MHVQASCESLLAERAAQREPHSIHLAVDMGQQKGQVQHTGPLLVSCVHYSVAGKSSPFLLLSAFCSLEIAKIAAKPECRSEALCCHSSLIFQSCWLRPQEESAQEDSVSLLLVLAAGFAGPSLALSSCLS